MWGSGLLVSGRSTLHDAAAVRLGRLAARRPGMARRGPDLPTSNRGLVVACPGRAGRDGRDETRNPRHSGRRGHGAGVAVHGGSRAGQHRWPRVAAGGADLTASVATCCCPGDVAGPWLLLPGRGGQHRWLLDAAGRATWPGGAAGAGARRAPGCGVCLVTGGAAVGDAVVSAGFSATGLSSAASRAI